MTLTIQQAIAKAREIERAATAGPWLAWARSKWRDRVCKQPDWYDSIVSERELADAEQIFQGDEGAYCDHPNDASLIAHARNTHALLLDIAEAAFQSLESLKHQSWHHSDEVTAALQAFADHMGKSCAE